MATRDRDLEQLDLLAVFHYVVAALAALVACLPIIHVVVGFAMVHGWAGLLASDPVARSMGWIFIVVGGFLVIVGWTFAGICGFAGRFLASQRRYTFCLVTAGLSCLFVPFGTILGVFTIVVLMRPSVKALFGD